MTYVWFQEPVHTRHYRVTNSAYYTQYIHGMFGERISLPDFIRKKLKIHVQKEKSWYDVHIVFKECKYAKLEDGWDYIYDCYEIPSFKHIMHVQPEISMPSILKYESLQVTETDLQHEFQVTKIPIIWKPMRYGTTDVTAAIVDDVLYVKPLWYAQSIATT